MSSGKLHASKGFAHLVLHIIFVEVVHMEQVGRTTLIQQELLKAQCEGGLARAI